MGLVRYSFFRDFFLSLSVLVHKPVSVCVCVCIGLANWGRKEEERGDGPIDSIREEEERREGRGRERKTREENNWRVVGKGRVVGHDAQEN